MPIYEYEHDDEGHECDERIETFQKMSEDALTECPKCGKACHRVLSRTHGKMAQPYQFVYEGDGNKLHKLELSSDKKVAESQMRDFRRSQGVNPDDREYLIP